MLRRPHSRGYLITHEYTTSGSGASVFLWGDEDLRRRSKGVVDSCQHTVACHLDEKLEVLCRANVSEELIKIFMRVHAATSKYITLRVKRPRHSADETYALLRRRWRRHPSIGAVKFAVADPEARRHRDACAPALLPHSLTRSTWPCLVFVA